jgi:hypothetical protein
MNPERLTEAHRVALAAVMCPTSHDGYDGIFPDGMRCYVCIARSLKAALDQATARAEKAEGLLSDCEARNEPFGRTMVALGSVQDQLTDSEAQARTLADALERIVHRLTAANGEGIAYGTGATLTARELARVALDEYAKGQT